MSSKAKQAKVAAMAPQAKQKQAEQAKAAAIDLQAKQTEAKQAKAAAIALQAKQAKAADPNHISERFVASLVKNINEAGIPCILWGNRLLRAHGVPTILGSIEFVVPEGRVSAAAAAIASRRPLITCPYCLTCPLATPTRTSPTPGRHFHIRERKETVAILSQSQALWFLPAMNDKLVAPSRAALPSYLILASDRSELPPQRPKRGSGCFKSAMIPVLAIPAHILVEAYMRLYARYAGGPSAAAFMTRIAWLRMYVEEDGYVIAKRLPQSLRPFYVELTNNAPIREWTQRLQKELGERVA
ncbi:unnamed protein product [Clonostachys rosea f. rosea IK726]|uniref:Uncharacterized protein n=1 Tax=Clonostachys rosea f. rosea IK726 TaxID=1349383 RepID=A0ACA9TZK6_BIOOC|nr:unnamed protein product [Clonostachys rosea f. rosea IK726]